MSHFASVLHLDSRAIKALRITDPYSLHRVVYGLFADVRDTTQKQQGDSSGILYVDLGGDARGRKILMLSNRAPAPHAEGGHGQVLTKTINPPFWQHSEYAFAITINPVKRENASRKIIPIKGRKAIAEWFCERAADWGFTVDADSLQVLGTEVQQFTEKKQREVTLAQAQLKGRLRVINRERFLISACKGIGKGRTFGCGLLRLVPLPTPTTPE